MTDTHSTTDDATPALPVTPRLVYTVREAAEELRLGYSTVRERIATGELRSFKDGSRRLIAGDDLLAYVRSRQDAA
jgi:excisionase family DNA binding protein